MADAAAAVAEQVVAAAAAIANGQRNLPLKVDT